MARSESGRGLPHSKTLARDCSATMLLAGNLLLLACCLHLLGCSSAKPPKAVPAPVTVAERNASQDEGADRSALRWSLSEPIEESGLPSGQRVADDSPVLLANAGRSWGP